MSTPANPADPPADPVTSASPANQATVPVDPVVSDRNITALCNYYAYNADLTDAARAEIMQLVLSKLKELNIVINDVYHDMMLSLYTLRSYSVEVKHAQKIIQGISAIFQIDEPINVILMHHCYRFVDLHTAYNTNSNSVEGAYKMLDTHMIKIWLKSTMGSIKTRQLLGLLACYWEKYPPLVITYEVIRPIKWINPSKVPSSFRSQSFQRGSQDLPFTVMMKQILSKVIFMFEYHMANFSHLGGHIRQLNHYQEIVLHVIAILGIVDHCERRERYNCTGLSYMLRSLTNFGQFTDVTLNQNIPAGKMPFSFDVDKSLLNIRYQRLVDYNKPEVFPTVQLFNPEGCSPIVWSADCLHRICHLDKLDTDYKSTSILVAYLSLPQFTAEEVHPDWVSWRRNCHELLEKFDANGSKFDDSDCDLATELTRRTSFESAFGPEIASTLLSYVLQTLTRSD